MLIRTLHSAPNLKSDNDIVTMSKYRDWGKLRAHLPYHSGQHNVIEILAFGSSLCDNCLFRLMPQNVRRWCDKRQYWRQSDNGRSRSNLWIRDFALVDLIRHLL